MVRVIEHCGHKIGGGHLLSRNDRDPLDLRILGRCLALSGPLPADRVAMESVAKPEVTVPILDDRADPSNRHIVVPIELPLLDPPRRFPIVEVHPSRAGAKPKAPRTVLVHGVGFVGADATGYAPSLEVRLIALRKEQVIERPSVVPEHPVDAPLAHKPQVLGLPSPPALPGVDRPQRRHRRPVVAAHATRRVEVDPACRVLLNAAYMISGQPVLLPREDPQRLAVVADHTVDLGAEPVDPVLGLIDAHDFVGERRYDPPGDIGRSDRAALRRPQGPLAGGEQRQDPEERDRPQRCVLGHPMDPRAGPQRHAPTVYHGDRGEAPLSTAKAPHAIRRSLGWPSWGI